MSAQKTTWFQLVTEQQRIDAHFESQASYWDDVYTEGAHASAVFRERMARALAWLDACPLQPGARVLDAGCGAGNLAVAIARRGFLVDAVDTAPSMVDLARQHAVEAGVEDRVSVGTGDVHALAAESETYDVIFALGVVPWLHSPLRGLEELARVLRPGGWLIATCDNRRALHVLLEPMHSPPLEPLRVLVTRTLRRLGIWRKPPHGLRARQDRRRDFDRLLTSAGLQKQHSITFGFGPFTFLNRHLPRRLNQPLARALGALADRGVPTVRWGGISYMVMARKQAPDDRPQIHPSASVSPGARIGVRTRVWNEAQVREGAQVGDDCILAKGVYIDNGVVVGNRVKLENRVSVFNGARLADGVFIGPHSCLLNDKLPRAITPEGALKGRRDWAVTGVRVEEGASIGGGCTVLPGVTIGRFAMVGAGAVVTRPVPDYGLVVGNPARLIGRVCECGARLQPSGTCPSCGRPHELGETK